MKKAFSKKSLWEEKPSLISTILKRGLGIFPPVFLLGWRFRSNCKKIKHIQRWPLERTRQYKLLKLREITKLAYEKTFFYRHLFDTIGIYPEKLCSFEDMKLLPVIDKQIVSKYNREMCTRLVTEKDIDFISTGGTSGVPLHFYINAGRSAIEYAYLTTSWQRAGYKLGMPMAVLRGRTVKPDRNGLYHEYDPILRHHYYSTFHLSDENIARYLKHIATIGECFLHVYPSSAAALAKFIIRNKQKHPINIRGIIAESEIVYPQQRQLIEEVFGCRLFSCYGQTEKLVLACGCEKSDDYHVWSTYGYFELLDEQGNQVTTPGQRGEIVGTSFINTIMPFIRYRTGDWATYVGDHCPACGREHILIRDIQGHRIQEVLIANDGSEISWTALNMHDDTFLNVRQFQFLQKKPGQAVLRLVPADGFAKQDTDKIQRNLGIKLDGRVTFTIELLRAIPLSERGKAIYVDQQIPREN